MAIGQKPLTSQPPWRRFGRWRQASEQLPRNSGHCRAGLSPPPRSADRAEGRQL